MSTEKHNIQTGAIRRFPSMRRNRKIGMNSSMFMEDLGLYIMPLRGESKNHPSFTISIEGNHNDWEQAKFICECMSEYHHYSDTELICNAVERIAHILIRDGKALFYLAKDKANEKHEIYSFPSNNVIRLPFYYIQLIPWADRQHFHKFINSLSANDVWEVSFPVTLARTKTYKKMLRKIDQFNNIFPKFYTKDLNTDNSKVYKIDISEYVFIADTYNAYMTKKFGWDRRDYSDKHKTEFYLMYQRVTFRYAQAILREHIILKLNELFLRLGYNVQVKVSGIPSSQDLLAIREEMVKGRMDFGEVYNKINFLNI